MISNPTAEYAGGRVSNADVEKFVSFMQAEGRTGWTTAADYLRSIGVEVNEDNKRWVRLLRRETAGRVLGGPGFPGYKATKKFTQAEYDHWRKAMLAQSDDMKSSVETADSVFDTKAAVQQEML